MIATIVVSIMNRELGAIEGASRNYDQTTLERAVEAEYSVAGIRRDAPVIEVLIMKNKIRDGNQLGWRETNTWYTNPYAKAQHTIEQ